MRGRLINPFFASIAQLDTSATAADPDGDGPLASGYDEDFREPIRIPTPEEQTGTCARTEKPLIKLRCQVEPATFEALRQFNTGAVPDRSITLIFHFRDLERVGLVEPATGNPLLRVNDRLVAISDLQGNVVQTVRNPPGLFATEVQPRSFGIGLCRNLLLVKYDERETASRSAS